MEELTIKLALIATVTNYIIVICMHHGVYEFYKPEGLRL